MDANSSFVRRAHFYSDFSKGKRDWIRSFNWIILNFVCQLRNEFLAVPLFGFVTLNYSPQ